MKDKKPYKIKCVILSELIFSLNKLKEYYTCRFLAKILNCEDESKEYPKTPIYCEVINKDEVQKLRKYKKGQIIKMSARINKTIRITETQEEFIIH